MRIGQALEDLESSSPFKQLSFLARNAIRGSTYEAKWRGPLEAFPDLNWARRRAIERLEMIPEDPLPQSTAPVSIVGVGWGSYRWRGDHSLVETVVNQEASLIDTAETYGYGRVEMELGRALKPLKRRYTILATKVSRSHMSERSIKRAFARSRDKLGDFDLYQLHWPNPVVPLEESLGALGELNVESIGVCNYSVDQLATALWLEPRISTLQIRCAVEDHEAVEMEWLPYCRTFRVTLIAHSPFAQVGHGGAEALKWTLDRQIVPIPGTNNLEHLKENLSCEMQ